MRRLKSYVVSSGLWIIKTQRLIFIWIECCLPVQCNVPGCLSLSGAVWWLTTVSSWQRHITSRSEAWEHFARVTSGRNSCQGSSASFARYCCGFTLCYCWPTLRARCAMLADVGQSVSPLSVHGHISKTKRHKFVISVEHYYEVKRSVS